MVAKRGNSVKRHRVWTRVRLWFCGRWAVWRTAFADCAAARGRSPSAPCSGTWPCSSPSTSAFRCVVSSSSLSSFQSSPSLVDRRFGSHNIFDRNCAFDVGLESDVYVFESLSCYMCHFLNIVQKHIFYLFFLPP